MSRKHLLVLIFIIPFFALAQNDCNCCSEEHKGFDFWVGTWVVSNTNGSLAGNSVISKEEKGCVIRENWTSSQSGFTGTSLNFYNAKTEQWEQLWIDNAGNHLKLKGNRFDNQMILASEPFTHNDGNIYTNRITWTKNKDGTVRQLWELLEGRKVKNVLFDGMYRKKE